ncbi:RagB/SusD family nutrient uptake outer membrane protein [Sphingobacterium thalpophilum]|uniref:RagB/SusD family nutrient uptake outer membrane protein n=1 Tax=Sphingobacterium thalpophilum TaxID=259 RepID=UPI0037DA038C
MKIQFKRYLFFLGISIALSACTKDFLEKKPTQSTVVPVSLSDYQALLDDPNLFIYNSSPRLGALMTDDFSAPDSYVKTMSDNERISYLWEPGGAGNTADWFYPYKQVFNANIILDGLKQLDVADKNGYNSIKGAALFWRSYAFYNLLITYSKNYNKVSADTDLGIPLRLESDVNIKTARNSVSQGFEQIIADLKAAAQLLPLSQKHKSRPTRASAFALLARVFLSKGDFKEAGFYADRSLSLNSSLLDYRTLDPSVARPFPAGLSESNPEILFYSVMISSSFLRSSLVSVSQDLYKLYNKGDLRKNLYFTDNANGTIRFKGSYSGDSYFFSGITTREMYLVRAECYARDQKPELALRDLNELLMNRWDNSFVPLKLETSKEILQQILVERRKELVGGLLRFIDLKRLNLEDDHATVLRRIYDSRELSLPPNDSKYQFLIPEQEILASGIEQNTR